ncbi:MAG: hypothetical protein LJE95_15570 [Acidobacteria bacterium]|nr:hypothetical protein [Acidobacteriota bacterium]
MARWRLSHALEVAAITTILALLLGTGLAAAGDTLVAEPSPDLDGLKIVSIRIIRHNIFDTSDPATSAWPYRAANALHIVTRKSFIRHALLFHEGDQYSAARAAESARLLRSWGFLNPVHIEASRVPGGVEVTVETRDLWTLEVGGEAGLAGHRNRYGFSITENNLLGLGRTADITYRSEPERDSWTYTYFDPFLLGRKWQATIKHEDSTDGFTDTWHVERPFYSLADKATFGAEWSRVQLIDHLYSDGDVVVSGVNDVRAWRVWGGVRLPGDHDITRRLTVGFDHHSQRFADWHMEDTGAPYQDPENLLVDGLRFAYQQIPDRFLVLRGFRAWSVQEDVGLGPTFNIALTTSLPAFGGDVRRFLLDSDLSLAHRSGNWLLLGRSWLSGRQDPTGPRNVRAGFQVAAAQIGRRGWQGRLLVENSWRPDRNTQLTLGTDVGLRGWDPDTFDGSGRAVLNVQYRALLMEDVLHFFSIGFVGFVDAGATWRPRVGRDTDGIRKDAGVGLLVDLPRIGLAHLLRIEIAFPDDGSGFVATLTTAALF